MGRPKPFGIRYRSLIPNAVRRIGYKAFGTKGYFGEYFNQNIFEQAQEHVLGTSTQVSNDDATIWYDDTAGVFKDRDAATVTLTDFDRVAMIVDTADQDIDFPASTEIVFVPYDEVDLDSNTINLSGTYSGEMRANNGTIVITGTSHGLSINGTATVNTSGMTGGAVLVNGVLYNATLNDVTLNSPVINSATLKGTFDTDASTTLTGIVPIALAWVGTGGSTTKSAGAIASTSKTTTGTYTVTLDSIYSAVSVFANATILGASANYGSIIVLNGTGQCVVYIRDSGGTLADREFAIAIYSGT